MEIIASSPQEKASHPQWKIKEVARLIDVCELTIRRAIKAGRLKAVRYSRQCVRIPHEEVLRFQKESSL